jgi:hypothetical protein
VDNRSYDPDQQQDEPLAPGAALEGHSSVIGEHHEMPVPVDPLRGVARDISSTSPGLAGDQAGLNYQTYAEVGAIPDNTPVAHGGVGPQIPPPAQGFTPQGNPPPPGAVPPPQEGRGFPWLGCCGVGCGLGLVLVLLVVFVGVKYFKPLINAGMQLGNVTQSVKASGVPDKADVTVTPEELSKSAAQYEGQWVSLTGKISDDPGPSLDALRSKRGMQDTTGYVIDHNIMVLDVSGTTVKAKQGETIKLIGKPVILDFSMLGPITGGEIEKENKLGDLKQIVFVITNDVKVVPEEKSPEVTSDKAERDT